MGDFRVFMGPGGWQIADGAERHGPYPTHEQAVRTADNLNLQRRAEEERSFAPVSTPANTQGGQPLSDAQHRLVPDIEAGDRRDAYLTTKSDGEESVMHGAAPEMTPAQMVSETEGATPDTPIGDVIDYPDGPSVWEAVEDAGEPMAADEEKAAAEAVERARVPSTDSPAAGSASRGGGLV